MNHHTFNVKWFDGGHGDGMKLKKENWLSMTQIFARSFNIF